MNWFIRPPVKPKTWVDPTGELPPFLRRRLVQPRKQQDPGKFLYKHPYVRYMEDLVLWSRNEHNAEFHWYANNNNLEVIAKLRKYGSKYILAINPDFKKMVEIMTPEMWNLFDRRMRDHIMAAYEVAKQMKIVRGNIEVTSAIKMLREIEPEKPTKKNMVKSLIDYFIPSAKRRQKS